MSSRRQSGYAGKSEWDRYCRDVIRTVAEGIVRVIEAKKQGLIMQKKLADKFLAELRSRQDEVLKVFLYTVKPEFRDVYIEVMDKVTRAAVESYGEFVKRSVGR